MKTDLIVACPHCGKEACITMEHKKNDLVETMILQSISPEAKQYTFRGGGKCSCGKMVLAALTVTG